MATDRQDSGIEGEWVTGIGGTVAALVAASLLAWAGSQHGAEVDGCPVEADSL